MLDVEDVLAALERQGLQVRPTGPDRWMAQCPAHDDRVASLSIGRGQFQSLLLRCWAGCPFNEVIDALDIDDQPRTDEQPAPSRPPRAETPAMLPTEPMVGNWQRTLRTNEKVQKALHRLKGWSPYTLRGLGLGFDGKRLTIHQYDPSGERLVNLLRYDPSGKESPKIAALKGRPRVLWPAPESYPLWWSELWLVEGEPDAISAAELQIAGVALPGVQSWQQEWAPRFTGRSVRIVMDCDEQGREAAERIAADLKPHAANVQVIDLEPKRDDSYDLTDFLLEAVELGPVGLEDARRLMTRLAENYLG